MSDLPCPRCGEKDDYRIQVQAVVSAPASLYHQFSKQNLRQKEVYLMGVLWETTDFVCGKCGFTVNGYGNYVTSLKKENEDLKKKLEERDGK